MASDRPVMLLDVDGVINAHGPYADIYKKGQRRYNPHWDCRMSNDTAQAQGRDWQFWWAQPLADQLIALHQQGSIEIRWCSTWNSDAAQIENMLGWPVLRVAFPTTGVHTRDIARLKRAAAARVLAQGRRLIWADDNEVPFEWELAYAALAREGHTLLLRPREALGLVPGHLQLVRRFVGMAELAPEQVTS